MMLYQSSELLISYLEAAIVIKPGILQSYSAQYTHWIL